MSQNILDFIDLGCSIGSIEYSKNKFGGKTCLGINKNLDIVKECIEKNYHVIQDDIVNLKKPLPKCNYIVCLHVLEHLNDEKEISRVINTASRTALDFIYFSIPNFDDKKKLEDFGLKFSWDSYVGHKCKIHSDSLKKIISDLNLTAKFGKSILIKNSFDKEVLPISAPLDTLYYDVSLGEKKFVEFNEIYRENYVFIKLRQFESWENLLKTKLWNK